MWLFYLFAAASTALTAFGLFLRARQAAYVARHRDEVPEAFRGTITLADHQFAANYERARLQLGAAAAVYGLVLTLAWAAFGYGALFGSVASAVPPGLTRSVVFLVAIGAFSSLLGLPFAVARTFGVERRFGFNRTSPWRFIADRAKGAVLSLLLGVPLLYAGLWLVQHTTLWWLWGWLGLVALMLIMVEVYPRWIAPWFNRFTPLQGPLRERVADLLRRCGFRPSGLFVIDASRRSSHGNAYFTGLGRSKRIVLFDTLIAQHSEAELEAVLAHELGHAKYGHIVTGLARSAVVLGLGCLAVGVLAQQPWLLPAFGIGYRDPALSLLVAVLVVQLAAPVVGILGNWISRRHEYQADDFARRMVGAEPMASALVRLARENASTLTTDPLYALVNFTHPPVPLRVQRLLAAEAG